ncbi:MAG: hypothetical protein JSV44_07985, partial [Candidatus Zixiibacteriota bacterium]
MAIEFNCANCENKITLNYLKPGDVAKCRHCGANNVVPGSQSEGNVSLSDIAVPGDSDRPGEPEGIPPQHKALAYLIKTLTVALIFYAINMYLGFATPQYDF